MNFRNKYFYMLIMLCVSANTFAQNIEQIYMKSGSVIEGYIAEQKPGKHITCQTTKATIVVNSDSLQNRITERIPFEALSTEWQGWAEQNKKYIENGGQKLLELTTLEFRNIVYPKVYLLEKGSLIKFIDLSPNAYTFKWNDMYRTVKKKRPDNLFSGLKEILVLSDNSRVEGQIIEQYPGKDLKIETDNGEVLSFKSSDVKQIITEKINEKLDLWVQIPLLDKIRVKGDTSEFVGFISSRTLGKELVFEFENGEKRTIPQNQVISYAKLPNKKYVAAYDKVLKEGEILLDGEPAYFVQLKTVGQYLVLGSIVSAQKHIGETVCFQANLSDTDTPITLVKAHVESVTIPDEKRKREIPYPVITYQDLVQSPLPFVRETTPLGNIKITFEVEEAGDYVLYIQGQDGYIVINVIK
jgi:hypothetical protein